MQRMMKAETTFTPAPTASGQNGPQPPVEGAKSRSLWILWLVIVCVLGGIAALVVYRLRTNQTSTTGRRGAAGAAIPVDAVAAERGDLPIFIDGLLGTVTSLQTVTIHTRVDGQLVKVAFVEGEIVHQGDLLAQIDPNPFKAQLEVAQGQLAKDQASLADAQLDLNRFKQAPLAYTQQQIDTQQALVEQDAGIAKSDQGAVDNAKVNLDYCTITSPVTGRIGLRLVDEGNIVNTTDATGLAVLTQLQPITVAFSVQQDVIPDVVTHSDRIPPLESTALDGDKVLATGKLASIDSQVDVTTGMVKLKAMFDNKNNELFPNQLLTIRLKVNTLRNAVLVPSEAVQTGPDFSFVYVIKSDNTVEVRKIKPGQDEIVNGQDLTAINDGLSPKELVVTNGVDKLQAGSKVDPTVQKMTGPTTRSSTTHRPGTCAGPSPAIRISRTPRGTANEPVQAIHTAACSHIPAYDRHPAGRHRRLSTTLRVRLAGGGLPDDRGRDVLSGRRTGRDGLIGDRAAGTPIRPGAGPEPDDLHQQRGKLADHAAIFVGSEHRHRRAGSSSRHQRRDQLFAG